MQKLVQFIAPFLIKNALLLLINLDITVLFFTAAKMQIA